MTPRLRLSAEISYVPTYGETAKHQTPTLAGGTFSSNTDSIITFLKSNADPKRQAIRRTLFTSGRHYQFGDELMRVQCKSQLRLATKRLQLRSPSSWTHTETPGGLRSSCLVYAVETNGTRLAFWLPVSGLDCTYRVSSTAYSTICMA